MMEWPLGVRKGSWTEEEDRLLRNCVHQYGEGSWHLVPSRAGLNRCRKSCRLRWLNYVKPGIKRGAFTDDEVDLIIRLHNLLGNRWSLIAGRLPGRTGNDVKNYWNTHLQKRSNKSESVIKEPRQQQRHQVIRPRPRTLPKARPAWLLQLQSNHDAAQAHTTATAEPDDWWENLLQQDPEIFNFDPEIANGDSTPPGYCDTSTCHDTSNNKGSRRGTADQEKTLGDQEVPRDSEKETGGFYIDHDVDLWNFDAPDNYHN